MGMMELLPADELTLPAKGRKGTANLSAKGCGLITDTCHQCGEAFTRRKGEKAAYRRPREGQSGEWHFCTWKCVRDYDRENGEKADKRRPTLAQRIERKKARNEEDRRRLEDGSLTSKQRKAILNRISHRSCEILRLEEEAKNEDCTSISTSNIHDADG